MCVCVRACVRTCVRACMRACVYVCFAQWLDYQVNTQNRQPACRVAEWTFNTPKSCTSRRRTPEDSGGRRVLAFASSSLSILPPRTRFSVSESSCSFSISARIFASRLAFSPTPCAAHRAADTHHTANAHGHMRHVSPPHPDTGVQYVCVCIVYTARKLPRRQWMRRRVRACGSVFIAETRSTARIVRSLCKVSSRAFSDAMASSNTAQLPAHNSHDTRTPTHHERCCLPSRPGAGAQLLRALHLPRPCQTPPAALC